MRELTYIAAISEAIAHEMERDPDVLVLGEDVGGDFGGAFKVTEGLAARFGDRRVLNTPLAEQSFIGMANGMALMGLRPIVEVQFADFISTGFDSIVQSAATIHYRFGGKIPWVIRAPSDGGIRSGPFHSQNPEAWFVHTPGLKVVAPSNPADAKGLLCSAVRDPNPVVYFEAKPLYRSLRGPVPEGEHLAPIGEAAVVRPGTDLTVVAYGSQVSQALAAATDLAADGIEAEVVDLRSLKPLDFQTVAESVSRTSRAVVVHSANRLAGVGAEVAARIAEECFEWLDAPVTRLGGLDVPIPFSPPLEDAYRPDAQKIADAARRLAAY
ncbi:MAG: alpha-ketoacid dehydrogenase subunit beta [Acidimicrobiia bacterium]|nr:alpha-ketoacid dehydrogenase subunit beta [Acidimicrobiia bacterium]MYA38142.1 alpha-ketoacid dehydrogenase subunit beta [Acidimicrobiia bacterium]MYB79477.1 alpha-ketoacid dehydrogenase subunit beta [Acidimicrobiia bacterium]MYD40571.1 alpha-ketoacid dehydrogenase subunit beta [Acidimicrobiia bacterium]MYG93128.1 alpha-ketoacid dehydrogenase subunit beta [Acidimicrobiia bacterium]